jgi:hypothetical protein
MSGTIAIPTFKNETLLPRIEVLVTGTVIKQFSKMAPIALATRTTPTPS